MEDGMASDQDKSNMPHWHRNTAFADKETVTITLWPHRSLSYKGFRLLMLCLASLMSMIATGLYMLGAWPVIGFLGAEIFIIWFAFKMNYKSGQLIETVVITPGRVKITRTDWRGRQTGLTFESAWIRAELTSKSKYRPKLFLRHHSQKIEIGAFMPPVEKKPLAKALNEALLRMRFEQAAHMPG